MIVILNSWSNFLESLRECLSVVFTDKMLKYIEVGFELPGCGDFITTPHRERLHDKMKVMSFVFFTSCLFVHLVNIIMR